jgi:hypothetical protein
MILWLTNIWSSKLIQFAIQKEQSSGYPVCQSASRRKTRKNTKCKERYEMQDKKQDEIVPVVSLLARTECSKHELIH